MSDHGIDDEELRFFAEMVIELEGFHHEQGWDSLPPLLYLITNPDIGDESVRFFGASPMPLFDAPNDLFEISVTMKMLAEVEQGIEHLTPEQRMAMVERYSEPPMAHVLVLETWMRYAETREELDAMMADERALADMPGTIEARQALLVHNGDCIVLVRERGKEPRLNYTKASQENGNKIGGEIIEPLLMLDGASRTFSEKLKEARP